MSLITNWKKQDSLKVKVHPEPIPVKQSLCSLFFRLLFSRGSYWTGEGLSRAQSLQTTTVVHCLCFFRKESHASVCRSPGKQDSESTAHPTPCPWWLRGPQGHGAGRGHVVGLSPPRPRLFFTESHPHPYHGADNPLPVLPQTQWKVNWMFYALAISQKWKARRFQPYFNNQCIHFHLLTDTCTNFLKCSPRLFSDLSALSADEEGWLQMRTD